MMKLEHVNIKDDHFEYDYMGTHLSEQSWQHEFRHRCHPETSDREYIAVFPSERFLSLIHKITKGPLEDLPLCLGLGFDSYIAKRLKDE